MIRRYLLAGLTALAAVLAPATPAAAHGGSDADVTSNYRTSITDISDIDGLTAKIVGIDGTIEIAWTGPGSLLVAGYEGEPYLRIDATGVSQNMRSPATYLNQDRYANIELPDTADAGAEPDWQLVTEQRRYQWHDHRVHWMSPTPPSDVVEDDNRTHVIYDRWEIPLTVDGRDAVIAGQLTWTPPPPLLSWLAGAAAIAAAGVLVLWSRWWRIGAALLAAVGTLAITIDTIGFVAVMDDSVSNRVWAFIYSVLAAAATARLIVHAKRVTSEPTLAMMSAGLLLLVMGGIDRLDVLTASHYFSGFPAVTGRVAAVMCIGIGAALVARFLAFLIPLVVRPPERSTQAEPDVTPA